MLCERWLTATYDVYVQRKTLNNQLEEEVVVMAMVMVRAVVTALAVEG